jgi:hypothetical protein
MRVRPVRLNGAVAGLFVVGSFCFVLGSVPAYVSLVGGVVDDVTYVVGSIFFTSAALLQLLQAHDPALTEVDERGQNEPVPLVLWRWRPHDRGWLAAVSQFPGTLFFNVSTAAALAHNTSVQYVDRHVWRPDFAGSVLFLVASVFGILAIGRLFTFRPRSFPWWTAWLNMTGSILFMASALASVVLPATGEELSSSIAAAGTLLGAACFLVGAALLIPGWRVAVADRPAAVLEQRPTP